MPIRWLNACTVRPFSALLALLRTRRKATWLAGQREGLAARTAQLEATLAGMSDGIMVMDADLRLLAWNDKFPELAGVPREILRIGLPAEAILRAQAEAGEFGPVDVELEVARRIELINAGGSVGTIQRMRPNGRVLELHRNLIAGGGYVTRYTDVTARQHAQERLQEAQRLAALGRVAAGIVHDFNNLLSNIITNAELLERSLDTGLAAQRQVAIITQSAERGAELVRRLLTFARKQPLAAQVVDLNHIVRGMQILLQSTIGASVEIETDLSIGLWPALVDPVQLEHVILNLAINARDAMQPGGGRLTISTANLVMAAPRPDDLPKGDFVYISVRDTGTGMTEEVRREAFEPFFTTKPAGYGTGLGLSQVYGFAVQSGGLVEIDTVLGAGTTVTVYLPRAEEIGPRGPGSMTGLTRSAISEF